MNILTADNITKSYGVRKIFDGASFFLQEGEKAGIIGINGTGKSTLLKIIAGLEETDDGTVIKANHCKEPQPLFLLHPRRTGSLRILRPP